MSTWKDEEQIQRLIDGEVSESEFAAIEQRVKTDPGFRKLYLSYAKTDHLLIEHHESDSAFSAKEARNGAKWFWVAGIAAAVALVIGLTLPRGADPADTPLVGPTLASLAFGPESAGQITHVDGRTGGDELKQGSVVELVRGGALIQLSSGVSGFVEAPATFEAVGENALKLVNGRAWFNVPDGAEGFICETADMVVEDLGTEFGVIAETGKPQEVFVLSGKVKLRDPVNRDEISELITGQGVSWMGDRWEPSTRQLSFSSSFPEPIVVFADDFSDPNGTLLDGKEPDIGGSAWKVQLGQLQVRDGKLDTRGELRSKAFVDLGYPHLDDHSHILLMTIEAEGPGDEGWAGVSLYTGDQERIFVGDPNGPDGDWALHPAGEVAHNACPLLAGKSLVTLRYNYRTGLAELFEGRTTTGKPLASQWIAPHLSFDRLRIANGSRNDALIDAGMELPDNGSDDSAEVRSQITVRRITVKVLNAEKTLRTGEQASKVEQ